MNSSASSLSRFVQLVLSGRFLRIAAGLYGASSLLLWVVLTLLFVRGRDRALAQGIGPDFAAFYTAGTMFRQGEKARLYDFSRQQEIQHQLGLTRSANEVSAFINPAHYSLLMAPLSTRSPRQAYAIFALTMFACFAGGLLLLRDVLPFLQGRNGGWILLLALLSPPVYFSISAGQNTGSSFLLHCAIMRALMQRRDLLAGALCGLGLFKPHLFLPLVPLLALGGRPRAVLSFLVVAAATVALDVAVFGSDVFARNAAALQTPLYNSAEIAQSALMFSWQAFWRLLLGPGMTASLLGWLSALAVFGALCVLWRRAAPTTRRSDTSAFARSNAMPHHATTPNDAMILYAISLCGVITIVPHLPLYDLGLFLLPMLVVADRVLDFPTTRFMALRVTMLALIVFTAMGEDFARQTHFQIVVPLLTLLGFFALKLNEAAAPDIAQGENSSPNFSHATP